MGRPIQLLLLAVVSGISRGQAIGGGGFTFPTQGNTATGGIVIPVITTVPTTVSTSTTTTTIDTTTEATTKAVAVAPVLINSGDIKIKITSPAAPCLTHYRKPTWLQFASPNFPKNYQSNQFCSMSVLTDEPRYLLIKVVWIDVHSSDQLYVETAFGKKFRIRNNLFGRLLLSPTAWAHFTFQSDSFFVRNGYLLEMVQYNSQCHKKITLSANSKGTLTLPRSPYDKYTVCEWWIVAEPGSKVELKMLTFEMGDASSTCPKDYLGVDKSGDPAYNTDSSKYCGNNNPGTIVSNGNRLNVLAFGWHGGKAGFTAEYKSI